MINLYIFLATLYRHKYEQIGFMRIMLGANLLCLCIYNMIYACEAVDNGLSRFLGSFFNALMMSLILFLNLVIIDS